MPISSEERARLERVVVRRRLLSAEVAQHLESDIRALLDSEAAAQKRAEEAEAELGRRIAAQPRPEDDNLYTDMEVALMRDRAEQEARADRAEGEAKRLRELIETGTDGAEELEDLASRASYSYPRDPEGWENLCNDLLRISAEMLNAREAALHPNNQEAE